MPVQRVRWSFRKTEPMSTCADLAARWFDMTEDQIEAACGRFVRGANKGRLRGWIVWVKAEVGGWSRAIGVVRPGMIYAVFCKTYEDATRLTCGPDSEFFTAATRVDSQYGYDRVADLARRSQENREREAKVREEQLGRAKNVFYDALDLFADANGRQANSEEKAALLAEAYKQVGVDV